MKKINESSNMWLRSPLLGLLCLLLFSGCSSYYERFSFTGEEGQTHTVDVQHHTLFMFGKAANLNTDTQTEEFIRTVNATGVSQKPDGVDQIVSGVIKGLR